MNTSLPRLLTALLPQFPGLRLQRIVQLSDQFIVRLVATARSAGCPHCGTPSTSTHSHYPRSLADLPWGTASVQILLHVRKFRCANPGCSQRIFSERFSPVVAPYARRTARCQSVLRALGGALGGRAATRLARQLNLPGSRTSLLRLVCQAPLPVYAPLRVIGVDDWAFRRGHHYGTIIVDLERHQPIALLPDRQADTLVTWLLHHPSIKVISRDRASVYADAARRGAPHATQVADRWHLLKNLTDVLEQFFLTKRPVLKSAVPPPADLALRNPAGTPAATPVPTPPPCPAPITPTIATQRHTRYLEQYQQIQALAAQHLDVASIARQVGVSRGTVYRYRRMAAPPTRKQPGRRGSRLLDPYEGYVRRRWHEGCRNAKQLWREIQAQGYACSAHTVERFVGQLRANHGQRRSFRAVAAGTANQHTVLVPEFRPYTARQAALLFTARSEQRSRRQREYITRLCAADGDIATTYQAVDAFGQMLRERQGGRLDSWLQAVAAHSTPEVQRFAQGIQADYAAVQAGLTEIWSQGQVEGQVQRLKVLKRQMYGRASFALLRQRVLQRAPTARELRGRRSGSSYRME